VPDLAFTLLLRLPDGYQPDGQSWIDWRYSSNVVPPATYGDPHDEPPFKRYPGTREYFTPQVEAALFPAPTGKGAPGRRWIRRPPALSLEIGDAEQTSFQLRVDLLEVVRLSPAPNVAFGIAHLSVPGHPSAADMLECSRLLSTRYRESPEASPIVVVGDGSKLIVVEGHTPLLEVTKYLFGAAHVEVHLRAYLFAAARVPDDLTPDELPAWRRALGQGQTLKAAHAALAADPERDDRRNLRLGPTVATFFGRSAAHTHRGDPAASLRNMRSYWSEVVLFGLIQYAYIEEYAKSLSRLGGDPLGREINDLFVRWLAFRNTLWWHHPSFTTDIAERILRRVHRGLRTHALYEELESGFGTYVEARRHRAEESEGRAIRSLQIFGAAFAAVSTVGTIMLVAGQGYLKTSTDQIVAVLSLVAVGLIVGGFVTVWLTRRNQRYESGGGHGG
jgi:hypothetical protein